MKDDYLWDRSGPPDPEIERLERTLAPLRYRLTKPGERWNRYRFYGAIAAAILVGIALWQFRAIPAPPTAWQIASLEGTAHLGGRAAAVSMPVRVGQVLRTGDAAQVTLQADVLGRVDLGPNSEMRAATDRRLSLRRGQLHAFIWAPPRQFEVDTPSARAVDLGCEYTLNVDSSGDGLLRVALGWVAFQFGDHESFIPAGAQCMTRKRGGPGIPYYEDAPEALRHAVSRYELGDDAALDAILSSARPRDGLTLWHLLTRVSERRRADVFDRFAQLVAVPAQVSRDAVVRKDPRMIDLCWDALNLENTSWWRGWERKW
jgi:hypothetical protein